MIFEILKAKAELNIDDQVELLSGNLSDKFDRQRRNLLIDVCTELAAVSDQAESVPEKPMLARIERKCSQYLSTDYSVLCRRSIRDALMYAYNYGKNNIMAKASKDPYKGQLYTFDQKDLDAIDALEDYGEYYASNYWDEIAGPSINQKIKEYFDEGITTRELAARLQEDLGQMLGYQTQKHFEVMADTMVSRVREYGKVRRYELDKIKMVQVVAVLDNRTTAICRRMHNRILMVEDLASQRDKVIKYAQAGNYKAVHQAHAFYQNKDILGMSWDTRRMVENGVGMPPYHFRCRSTTVPYFGTYSDDQVFESPPEIEKFLAGVFGVKKVDLAGIDLDYSSDIRKGMLTFAERFPKLELSEIKSADNLGMNTLLHTGYNVITQELSLKIGKNCIRDIGEKSICDKIIKDKYLKGDCAAETFHEVVWHEMWHAKCYQNKESAQIEEEYIERMRYHTSELTKYAEKNGGEAIAEGGVMYMKGIKISKRIKDYIEKYTGVRLP